MVRRATEADIEAVLGLVSLYYEEQGYADKSGIALHGADVQRLVSLGLYNKRYALYVHEDASKHVDGVLGGLLTPWPVNTNVLAAQEFIAFGNGITEMREHFDQWATKAGARTAMLSCFLPASGDRMRRL